MKRLVCFVLSVVFILSALFGTLKISAFEITNNGDTYYYFVAADLARILGNKNIFYAHFYGNGNKGENSVDNNLRDRKTSMLYDFFAEKEKENDVRVSFDVIWNVLSVNGDRFLGIEEKNFYSGLLWQMLTGEFNGTDLEIAEKMEAWNSVADGMVMEFLSWYCKNIVKENTEAKAAEVLEKFKLKDQAMLDQVQIWYGDHYSSVNEEIDEANSFFDGIDEVLEYGQIIMNVCDSAFEFIQKMSQVEALYKSSKLAYVDFLTELISEENTDPQLLSAANDLIQLLNYPDFDDALKAEIIRLVCENVGDFAINKVTDLFLSAGDEVLSGIEGTAASSVLAGIKIGVEACNLILGIDDKLVARYNILLLDQITDQIFNAAERLREKYYTAYTDAYVDYYEYNIKNYNVTFAADAYVVAVEMCYRFLLQTDLYVEKYISQEYNNWWDKYWGNDSEIYMQYKEILEKEIDSLKNSYQNVSGSAESAYAEFVEMCVNTVTYDADGWENVPKPQVKEFGIYLQLSDKVPTKPGYIFGYWCDLENGGTYKPGDMIKKNYSEDIVLVPSWTLDSDSTLSTKRQAVVDRAYEWYNKTWVLEQDLELWHSPYSTGTTIPSGTTVRGIPYTQFNCKYSIDNTLPGSTDYFSIGTDKYSMVSNTYCPGVQANRTAPKYGAECVQLVYDAWYHGDSAIGNRDTEWSLIIGDNKTRGFVKEITWDKIQPGDALVISSHIRLVVGVNSNNTPGDCTDDTYEVIEQTTSYLGSNNNIGTTKHTYTYSNLINGGYTPYCYVCLDSDSGETTPKTYSIMYDWGDWVDGVVQTKKYDTKQHGVDYIISTEIPTYGSYVFKGWALDTDLKTPVYQPGDVYTANADVVFYAVWADPETPSTTKTVSGTIKDATTGGSNYGNPISGVTVEFFDSNGTSVGTAVTNSEGVYTFTFPSLGTYKAVLTKAGYDTVTVDTVIVAENTSSLGIQVMMEVEDRNIIAEGTCGADLTWGVDDNGLLTIDGTGAMEDYSFFDDNEAPWDSYTKKIKTIKISNKVTNIGDYAFFNCKSLTSVEIPDSVTSIGDYAFDSCSSLTSIEIPNSVTSIGDHAFDACASLTSVTIPDSVTNIGDSAFYGCSSLASIEIPDGVMGIGNGAFSYCRSLTSITIPDSVTSIGNNAFKNCNSLTSVVIPDGVTSIGAEAFQYCSSLTSVVIPDSVTNIGYEAFSDCSSLTSINIPGGVVKIPNGNSFYYQGVFSGCTNLERIIIEDGVESIGSYAFYGCSSLISVEIPDSVTSIGDKAFFGCSSVASLTIGDGVASIGDEAFYDCSSVASLTIGDSVASIGYLAFCNCSSLTSVVIPASVTSIGHGAFSHCSSLVSATFETKNVEIGSSAFDQCDELNTIYCYKNSTANAYFNPYHYTKIHLDPESDFEYSVNSDGLSVKITKYIGEGGIVTIPSKIAGCDVTGIGDYAFDDCDYVTSVVIPNSVTSIGDSAFSSCSSLKSVSIPNSVTSIGWGAFSHCSSLASVVIGDGVTSIGVCAFYNCDGLASVTIPASVTSIGEAAFGDCSTLVAINVDNANAEYCDVDGVLFSKDKKILVAYPGGGATTYTIPASVTSIGRSAFDGCSSLTSVSIPDSVTSIDDYAFCDCYSITSIVIPNSVLSVGYEAFYSCDSLTSVTFETKKAEINYATFRFCSNLKNIYCYKNSTADAYFSADKYTKIYLTSVSTPGDPSGDGEINAVDAVLLAQAIAGWDVEFDVSAADCNGDGEVNAIDAVLLAQKIAGWDVILG